MPSVDPKTLRVLHAIAPADFGGAETVVRALAQGARAAGCDVRVAVLIQHAGSHPFVAELQAAGVPVDEIRCGRRRYLSEVRALSALIRRLDADVLHTHGQHADVVGLFAAHRAGVPVISTAHGFVGGDLKNRFYQWLNGRMLRRFDAVIAVSGALARDLARKGVTNVRTIPNGMVEQGTAQREEARRRLELAGTGPFIGWVGRLSHEKGPDLFLDALKRLDLPGAQAVIVGSGPAQAMVEAAAGASAPVGVPVRWVGNRTGMGALLKAFDVLVLSSRTEGLPMVLLEAAAARVPIVAFAVGGIPEVLSNHSSWLASPGDCAALADGMRSALDDPDEAALRAQAAHDEILARFGQAQWLHRHWDLYAAAAHPDRPDGSR